jgi:hypothetical protein
MELVLGKAMTRIGWSSTERDPSVVREWELCRAYRSTAATWWKAGKYEVRLRDTTKRERVFWNV